MALIFCLLNGEVLAQVKRTCAKVRYTPGERHSRPRFNSSFMTQVSDMYTRDLPSPGSGQNGNAKSYIPLQTIEEKGEGKVAG